jgi:hypothetical protein
MLPRELKLLNFAYKRTRNSYKDTPRQQQNGSQTYFAKGPHKVDQQHSNKH